MEFGAFSGKNIDMDEPIDYLIVHRPEQDHIVTMGLKHLAEGRPMNIQTSHDFPARPADFLDRSTEIASRAAGLAAFGVCLLSLLYVMAF